MCDFNEDVELDESKDDFDIAFEKEFGTVERDITSSGEDGLAELKRMAEFAKRWHNA